MTTLAALDLERLPGCGAKIHGLDVRTADDATIEAIRRAVFEHGVVFFEGQQLEPGDQVAFARRLGPIVINRFFPKTEQWPEIAKVEKTPDQTSNIGGGWHTDHSYDLAPAMGSVLLAVKTPPTGGDTLFADMYAAYAALSDEMKARLTGLTARHASAHVFGEGGDYAQAGRPEMAGYDDTPEAIHPVVITHPGSGRKALYVNPGFTREIVGMDEAESRDLLNALFAQAIRPEFVHRFSWRPGSMAIWDNRATWHYAKNDYHGHYRLMHRITLDGVPLSA